DEREALDVREEERLAEDRRKCRQLAGRRIALRLPEELREVGRPEVLELPVGHGQRRVALDEREPGEGAVALADLVELQRAEIEVLVLEGVRELVREGRLL